MNSETESKSVGEPKVADALPRGKPSPRPLEDCWTELLAPIAAKNASRRFTQHSDTVTRSMRITACFLARQKLKPHRRPPVGKLKGIAENLDARKGTTEPVTVYLIEKGVPNEVRIVLEYRIENRALQHLGPVSPEGPG